MAELALKNKVVIKRFDWYGESVGRMIRYSPEEKLEIIHLEEHSNMSIHKTLEELDAPRVASTIGTTSTRRRALTDWRIRSSVPGSSGTVSLEAYGSR